MTQQIGPAHRRSHSRTPQCVVHGPPHDAAADRRASPQPVQHEHLARPRAGAAVLQVVRQRRPHLARQRQQRAVTGLADAHPQRGVAPVEILQSQLHDLAGPQPQPGHAQDDRPVPQPARRGRIQRGDQLLQASGVQMPDKTGRTMRHHRDRVLQPVLTQPFRAQEPEERTQRRRSKLGRPGPVTACQAPDEAGHLASVDQRDLGLAVGEHRLQERPDEPGIVAPRPCAHATGAAQMLVEGREHFLQRQSIMRCHQLLLVFRTDRTQEASRLCAATTTAADRRTQPAHGRTHVQAAGLHITAS